MVAYDQQQGLSVDRRERKPEPRPPRLRDRSGHAAARARRPVRACPELDCVRHRLAPGTVAAIEARAIALGVGGDRVALAAGLISEEQYLRALAASLRIAFERLDDMPRRRCPLSESGLVQAAARGLLPLADDRGEAWAIAPRGGTARRLIALLGRHPALRPRIRLTCGADLRRFAGRHAAEAIGYRAAAALHAECTLLSAAPRATRREKCRFAAAAALAAAGALAAPAAMIAAMQFAMSAVFLGATGLRVFAAVRAAPPREPIVRLPDELLPVYSVIVALYREVKVVPDLVRALEKLDYPREKLDIKFVLEADDAATRRAIERMRPGASFEIILAPAAGPRTKPKALNAALPFALGAYTVVYDAEDIPEPDQLRRALNAFLADDDLACVQAALTINNADKGWLPRLFTAEYAAQFDVLLPALASLRLPLPLGGSSNHFPTAILRACGAWDAYNVTEDADLGTRLARLGYRTTTIASSTAEEAPTNVKPWLRQRARWLKGWMQTWLVHMRQPRRLARELGLAGFMSFQCLLAGTVLSALVQPIAIGFLLAVALTDAPLLGAGSNALTSAGIRTHVVALFAGYAAAVIIALVGLRRRKLLSHAGGLLYLPLLWGLLTAAAWWALYQLITDPYRWDKTEHGGAAGPDEEREGPAVHR